MSKPGGDPSSGISLGGVQVDGRVWITDGRTAKLVAEETEKWAKVVKFAGPKAE
jgi:hypothetical protein